MRSTDPSSRQVAHTRFSHRRPDHSKARQHALFNPQNEYFSKPRAHSRRSGDSRRSLPRNYRDRGPKPGAAGTDWGLFEKAVSRTHEMDQSDVTSSKVMRLLDPGNLVREIYFRYCHEANKVLFWLRTIRRIFDWLYASQISKAFLVFGCLLLIKAKIRTKFVYTGLLKRRNKYKLIRFDEFVESPQYEQALARFRALAGHVSRMESALAGENRFLYFVKLYQLEKVLKGDISDHEYHRVMDGQLTGIIRDKLARHARRPNRSEAESRRSREVFLIIVNVFFSKEIHSLFPYWVHNRKFDWARMDAKFANMTNSALKQIVLKLRDVL